MSGGDMGRVFALCGKIGSGKSFYAEKLRREKNAVVLSCDELMLGAFGQQAQCDFEAASGAVKEFLLKKAAEIALAGAPVVLDSGLWSAKERRGIRQYFRQHRAELTIIYISPPEEVRKRRIAERNALVESGAVLAYYVDEGLYEKCERLFEEPSPEEYDIKIAE